MQTARGQGLLLSDQIHRIQPLTSHVYHFAKKRDAEMHNIACTTKIPTSSIIFYGTRYHLTRNPDTCLVCP